MDHPPSTEWQEPTDEKKKAGYGKFPRPKTPYDIFMEEQEIPIYREIGVRKVQNLPLKPWKRMGGKGTFIQLLGTEGLWGCYLVEVPAGAKGGLNPAMMLEALAGTAASSRMMEIRGPLMAAEEFPPQMKLDIFLKDIRLMLEEGHRLEVPLPLTSTAQQLYTAASEAGEGSQDLAAVMKTLKRLAGLTR